ncbi:MAG: hypothetical protein U0V74_14445 [Chitinophagales bacterium]
MRKTLYLLIAGILSVIRLSAQLSTTDPNTGTFVTMNGIAIVNIVYNDSAYKAISNDLHIDVNYDNAEIMLTVDPHTFHTTNDTLNAMWKRMPLDNLWTYTGKLNVPYINTEDNDPEPVATEGDFTTPTQRIHLVGRGDLHCVNDASIKCIVTLTFHMDLSRQLLDIAGLWGMKESITVSIKQATLEKVK